MNTRDQILKTFNADFYFAVTDKIIWIQPGGDVFEAMAAMLRHAVLVDIDLPKRESVAIQYLCSADGEQWAALPIGPAYRQCSPLIQSIVSTTLTKKHGNIETLLVDGDVESMDEATA